MSDMIGRFDPHLGPMSSTKSGYRLFKDGNAWCATPPGFENLQLNPAGFGDTQEEAVAALLAKPAYQAWLRRHNASPPTLADFTIE